MALAVHMNEKPFSVAIVGGGISGLCVAIGLLHHRIPIHIYEAASQFSETGAGVSIGPSGCMALHLLDPDLSKVFSQLATKHTDNTGWESKKYVWMQYRYGIEESLLTEVSNKLGQTSVHRADLLDALISLIPDGTISFGKKIKSLEESVSSVKLTFESGDTANATFVIGADGIKSRTRETIYGSGGLSPEYSGMCVYRGVIDMQDAVKAVGKEKAMLAQHYMGKGGYVVTYPIQHGASINLGAFISKKGGPWEKGNNWIFHDRKADALKDFEGWGSSVKLLLNLLNCPSMWATFQMPLIPSNTKGRVCLVGDAAHATTPHQGSGCTIAIEDAFILSYLIGDAYVRSEEDVFAAFKAYDTICRPRGQKVIITSKECGDLLSFQKPGFEDSPELIAANLQERYLWIWNQNVAEMLSAARTEMIKLIRGEMASSKM